MTDFSLDSFMKNTNLIAKHPEIYESGKKNEIKKYTQIFHKYTQIANEENDINKLVKILQKDYDMQDEIVDKIESQLWNKHYLEYEVSVSNNMKLNDMYVFPHNTKGKKLSSPFKFYINCIRLGDSKNINIINRNGHMMVTGNNENNKILGTKVTYKMLILYNHLNKKWIVSPFKMVSNPPYGIRCDSFARSATTSNVMEQYHIWKKGLIKHGSNLGIINFKYTDPKFKNLLNLFTPSQTNQILIKAKSLSLDSKNIDVGGYYPPKVNITPEHNYKKKVKSKKSSKKKVKSSKKKVKSKKSSKKKVKS
jgi:hypothetical protein